MPHARICPETLAVVSRLHPVRFQALQHYFLVRPLGTRAALIPGPRVFSATLVGGCCSVHARNVTGGQEAGRNEGFAEEWAEDRAAGCCNSQASFTAGPDGDIGGGVEEVDFTGEGVTVWDTDYGPDRCSGIGSSLAVLIWENCWTYIAPIAKMRMTATFSFWPICRDQTRITGRLEKTRSPAHVIAAYP